MSLTLVWSPSETFHLYPPPDVRDAPHYIARKEARINKNVNVMSVEAAALPGARIPMVLKLARDAYEIQCLEREARFYQNELVALQGKYVPKFFGIFHGAILGVDCACILLEYCGGSPSRLSVEEQNRRIMLAGCAIHSAGICHNDLLDGRHFVIADQSIRIVDFGDANTHRCTGALPTLHPGCGGDPGLPYACRELAGLERTFGVLSGDAFPAARPSVFTAFAEGNPLAMLSRRLAGIMS